MPDTDFAVWYRPVKGAEEKNLPRQAALLPFEEFLPWREPKPYKGQRNARAYYWFSKTDRHVFCESRLEARVLQGQDSRPGRCGGYGVALRTETLHTFARVTRLQEEEVSSTLLARYDGFCCDLSGLDPASPRTFSRAALGAWTYFVGSHVCPSCLVTSDGVWRLRWKVPWSFACVEHGRLLADTWPGWGRRIGAGRRDGSSVPVFPSLVPTSKACRNALPKGRASAGRSSRPCGHHLDGIEAPKIDCPRVIEAQRRLDAAVAGEEVSVAGETVMSLDYFDDLRSVCALVLSIGEAKDLGDVPDYARQAFVMHVRDRQTLCAWTMGVDAEPCPTSPTCPLKSGKLFADRRVRGRATAVAKAATPPLGCGAA